ncbi:DUF6538 domain-containing protein [Nevskia ramosa]|uniref:DUF6538 domain-containing protein n=1 Tax=Nevskia ramosa TaxID=64002 RepID=UPI0003B4F5B5|nr:DUF6538 domain-containing protein [Nevskia ramosa]
MSREPFVIRRGNVLYFRIAIPADLRPALGRLEILKTLNTCDTRRGGPMALRLAADAKELFQALRHQTHRQQETHARPSDEPYCVRPSGAAMAAGQGKSRRQGRPTAAPETFETDYSVKFNFGPSGETQSMEVVAEPHEGDAVASLFRELRVSGPVQIGATRNVVPASPQPKKGKPVSINGLYDAYVKERQPKAKTVDSWRSRVKDFVTFIEHDDATLVTPEDVVCWKDELVGKDLAATTINNGYLAALRSAFKHGLRNKYLATDPTDGIIVLEPSGDGSKNQKPYTDEEARRMIGEARNLKTWLRWLPVLLAYTGARVEEIAGAMKADVREINKVLVIDLNEKHRHLKNTTSVRKVPLHSAIVSEGFLDYVATLPDQSPLFPDITPDQYGRRGTNASKINARWVRGDIGISDPLIQPAHAWRHRFADLCRDWDIPSEARYAIDGHKVPGVGASYGQGFKLEKLAALIELIPSQG